MKVLLKVVLFSLFWFMLSATDKKAIGTAISQIVENHFANKLSNLRNVKHSGNSTEIDGIANEI